MRLAAIYIEEHEFLFNNQPQILNFGSEYIYKFSKSSKNIIVSRERNNQYVEGLFNVSSSKVKINLITAIVGENGTGKSSVLDCIRSLFIEHKYAGIDGHKWIFKNRQKTDIRSKIPLLPIAEELVNKYSDHPKCVNEGHVLPVLSNQKMNSYLKEIGDVCGIQKEITFHMARHSFATSVTLTNGVPVETYLFKTPILPNQTELYFLDTISYIFFSKKTTILISI